MKALYFTFFLFTGIATNAISQTIDFSFSGNKADNSVALDSIWIKNCVQDCDTVLVWPDTVLSMMYNNVSDPSKAKNTFRLYPCYPNPCREQTHISIFVPDRDRLSFIVTDISGQIRMRSEMTLDYGLHKLNFSPGAGDIFFFTAIWRGNTSSIKIMKISSGSQDKCLLTYEGDIQQLNPLKEGVLNEHFKFFINDRLLFVGYANGIESGLFDQPIESKEYTLSFDYNIPCPGNPTIEYEGQVYNTVQIFNQCWLKENLNVGRAIHGYFQPSDNDTIEKYCYNNELANCEKYGGLYNWKEMMNYSTKESVQGICPQGWHIPSDAEWILLEGGVDSLYTISDTIWNRYWFSRGYDCGFKLKSSQGWNENGNGNDYFGYTGIPAGYRWHDGFFYQLDNYAFWWTSSQYSYGDAWYRIIYYYSNDIYRNGDLRKVTGMSVRCVKD